MRNPDSDVLTSWKAIAAYLGKGVRTVQRWEVELALPVHRPYKGDKGTVIALCSELDGWLRTHTTQVTTGHNGVTRKEADSRPHLNTPPLLEKTVGRYLVGRKLLSEVRAALISHVRLRRALGQQRMAARKQVDAMSKRLRTDSAQGCSPPPRFER